MTSVRDQFTETEENPNFSKTQFYQDAGGLNIGYGYCLTTNGGAASEAALKAAGFGTNFTTAQWNEILKVAAIKAINLTAAEVAQLNTDLGSAATITQTQAGTLLDNYYTNNVDNILPSQLETYADLTSAQVTTLESNTYAWAALQDLVYNAPGAISQSEVANLNDDLSSAVTSGNWGKVAYDIEYNPGTDVPHRREDEALLMLGFNGAGFGENNATSITPYASGSVSNQSVISYEQTVATGSQPVHANTEDAVDDYLATQGYYVPQTSSESYTTIAAQKLNGIILTGTELQEMNTALPGSSLTAGGLIYVPENYADVGTTPIALSSLTFTNKNSAYVYDAQTQKIYSVGAELPASGSTTYQNVGELYVVNSTYPGILDTLTGDSISLNAAGDVVVTSAFNLGTSTLVDNTNGTSVFTAGAVGIDLSAGSLKSLKVSNDLFTMTTETGATDTILVSGTATNLSYTATVSSDTVVIAKSATATVTGTKDTLSLSTGDTVSLTAAQAATDTISAFGLGSSIDITNFANVTAASLSPTDVLTLTNSAGAKETLNFTTASALSSDHLVLASDGKTGTVIENTTAVKAIGTKAVALAALPTNDNYAYDPLNSTLYTVPYTTEGNRVGGLFVGSSADAFNFGGTNNGFILNTVDPGFAASSITSIAAGPVDHNKSHSLIVNESSGVSLEDVSGANGSYAYDVYTGANLTGSLEQITAQVNANSTVDMSALSFANPESSGAANNPNYFVDFNGTNATVKVTEAQFQGGLTVGNFVKGDTIDIVPPVGASYTYSAPFSDIWQYAMVTESNTDYFSIRPSIAQSGQTGYTILSPVTLEYAVGSYNFSGPTTGTTDSTLFSQASDGTGGVAITAPGVTPVSSSSASDSIHKQMLLLTQAMASFPSAHSGMDTNPTLFGSGAHELAHNNYLAPAAHG